MNYQESFSRVDINPLVEAMRQVKLHKNELRYIYPSQGIMDQYYKWGSQFRDKAAWEKENKALNFEEHWDRSCRYLAYNTGAVLGVYRVHNWKKSKVLSELGESAIRSYGPHSVLPTIILCRALIEQASSVVASCLAFDEVFEKKESAEYSGDCEWLVALHDEIRNWTHATRINWEDYFVKGLRKGSRGSFSEEKNHFGRSASDLMKNVDMLSKKVKGARKAYELASEFTHPNYGPYALFLNEASREAISRDVQIWTRVYKDRENDQIANSFCQLLNEFFLICAECVSYAQKDLDHAVRNEKTVKVAAKRCVKQLLRAQPQAFRPNELCPCLSGKSLKACCG